MTNEEIKNKLIKFKKMANVNHFSKEFTIDRLIDTNDKLDDEGCKDCDLYAEFTNFVNETHSLDVNRFIKSKGSNKIKDMMVHSQSLFDYLKGELVNDLTEFISSGDFVEEFCNNNHSKYVLDIDKEINKLPSITNELLDKLGKAKVVNTLLNDYELMQELNDEKSKPSFNENELMMVVHNYVLDGSWVNSERGYYILQSDLINEVKEDIKND